MLVTGSSPRIRLVITEDIPDCPLELEIWVKICRDLNVLKERECYFLDKTDSSVSILLKDERILHNNKIIRMLKPILPKTLRNSTASNMKFLIGQKDKMLRTMEYIQRMWV